VRVERIAGATRLGAAVEGQEVCGVAAQASGHPHLVVGDGEVNERTGTRFEQRLAFACSGILWLPGGAVLGDRVSDTLGEVGL
jgi:hypothetical protein